MTQTQDRPQPVGDLKQTVTRLFNRATPTEVEDLSVQLCSALAESPLREQFEAAESLASSCSNKKKDCPLAAVSAELYSRMVATSLRGTRRTMVVSVLLLRRRVGHVADDLIVPFIGNFGVFFVQRLTKNLDAALAKDSPQPIHLLGSLGPRAIHHLGQLCVRGLVDPVMYMDKLLGVARREPEDNCSLDAEILASGLQTVGQYLYLRSREDDALAECWAELLQAIRAKQAITTGRPRFLLLELLQMSSDGWPQRTVVYGMHTVMQTPCTHRSKKGKICGNPSVGRGRFAGLCKLHQPQMALMTEG